LVIYFYILFLLLSLSNVYIIWLIIELLFIFFILIVLRYENKSVGLIIYFFFQRVVSLLLFTVIFFNFDKIIFLFLSAKLGLFPFFYWMVVVRIKIGFLANLFVLSLQKVSIFWIFWLLFNVSLGFLLLFVYLRIFFIIFNLLFIRDLWLLIVYSSIANTGIIILAVFGSYYIYVVFLYLGLILLIINFVIKLDSYIELLLLVFFFIVVPPFILFFIKFYIILSIEFILKIRFFLVFFDVFVLLYYFSLIFIKFLLLDSGVLIYFINILILLIFIFFRNCVTMIIFNES